MYDIYLKATLLKAPEFSDLIQAVPLLKKRAVQRRMWSQSGVPEGLGLELPRELAIVVLERFVAADCEGYYFPVAYHHPRISSEEALYNSFCHQLSLARIYISKQNVCFSHSISVLRLPTLP